MSSHSHTAVEAAACVTCVEHGATVKGDLLHGTVGLVAGGIATSTCTSEQLLGLSQPWTHPLFFHCVAPGSRGVHMTYCSC